VFVGEADGPTKRDLFRRASCIIMPISWDEPFGLVMAEALACGTPVIVFNRGAASEIVKHGETGFVVETIGEMIDAVDRVHTIDPHYCRKDVAERFDGSVMARRYLEIYDAILDRTALARTLARSSNGHRDTAGLSPTHAA
jgi:glycosyltransferase involved in cell wall biosynthesis